MCGMCVNSGGGGGVAWERRVKVCGVLKSDFVCMHILMVNVSMLS